MLADLPPVGAGLERLLHGTLISPITLDRSSPVISARLCASAERRALARGQLSMSDW
jgi:hypothetical protein